MSVDFTLKEKKEERTYKLGRMCECGSEELGQVS